MSLSLDLWCHVATVAVGHASISENKWLSALTTTTTTVTACRLKSFLNRLAFLSQDRKMSDERRVIIVVDLFDW